jgi:TATA-box binding protein (TBP) (component of TFIID and TFIIIB)
MTKKDFKKQISYHEYVGTYKPDNINAIFFDLKEGKVDGVIFRGFKYCIYARAILANKGKLTNVLYDFIEGKIQDTEYYIQLIVATEDLHRFKVPISGNDLYTINS